MSGSKSLYLDGINFRLSDIFFKKTSIASPKLQVGNVNKVLENCKYDFSIEHKVIAEFSEKRRAEKEDYVKQEKRRIHNSHKKSHSKQHPHQVVVAAADPLPSGGVGCTSDGGKLMKEILMPLPADPNLKEDSDCGSSSHKLDLNDFEINNQDPFSQAELNTIDDMKMLTDVLRKANITSGNVVKESTIPQPSGTTSHSNDAAAVTTATKTKQEVIDELADMFSEPQVKPQAGDSPPTILPGQPSPDSNGCDETKPQLAAARPPPPFAKPRSSPLGNPSHSSGGSNLLKNKSAEEKQKFEDTIRKALTSLPQLPTPALRTKPASYGGGGDEETRLIRNRLNSDDSVMNGLTSEERQFVASISSMGFKQQHVLLAMQKHGRNHKKVVDRLCICQRLTEKGFNLNDVNDALEVFDGKEKQASEYLQVHRQLTGMGFPPRKVKQALLLHNNNPTKAVEELMSAS